MGEIDEDLDGDGERIESYVVFELSSERYALEVSRVREVLDASALTPVPGGARGLIGLYNLRGHVVPVWDLRVPFELENSGSQEIFGTGTGTEARSRTTSVLMVEPDAFQSSRVAGLLVDRVSDVLDFLPEDLDPTPAMGLGGGSTFIRGLLRHHDRFLLVLDLDRVFEALTHGPLPGVP